MSRGLGVVLESIHPLLHHARSPTRAERLNKEVVRCRRLDSGASQTGMLREWFESAGLRLVVHVDAETLRDGTAGQCKVEDGPSVPAETARRLACDCSAVIIVENDKGDPLNVGRKTRSIRPALRRALNARDRGCRSPAARTLTTSTRIMPQQNGDWTQRLIQHDESDIRIDNKTATTHWRGERMDYSLAVESLVAKWNRERDASAGTL